MPPRIFAMFPLRDSLPFFSKMRAELLGLTSLKAYATAFLAFSVSFSRWELSWFCCCELPMNWLKSKGAGELAGFKGAGAGGGLGLAGLGFTGLGFEACFCVENDMFESV